MESALQDKLKRVKLLAMDFDGIHTDGRVFVDQHGIETVRCSRIDGMGLELLRRLTDVRACVISKEPNPVVAARCAKLKLPCHHNVDTGEGKMEILKRIAAEAGVAPEEILYMGDDVQDLAPMRFAGIAVTVPNGRPEVRAIARHVTVAHGGHGAIREICDLLLKSRGVAIEL